MTESTQMVSVETAKATGLALDWGLAKALGCTSIRLQHTGTLDGPLKVDSRDPDGFFMRVDHNDPAIFYSLLNKISVLQQAGQEDWRVGFGRYRAIGKTPAEAAARLVCQMSHGDAFNAPKELV